CAELRLQDLAAAVRSGSRPEDFGLRRRRITAADAVSSLPSRLASARDQDDELRRARVTSGRYGHPRLYEKTRVSRQADLAKLVAGFVSPLSV
ncbi:hypothetical protein, partial [Bradyrhizobium sp.]|uniref:hypothetical protein n=1 Tax=Bradyrhizobium sp. TaxID=376 RepID=UPI002D5A17B4